jgi:hypothetical protein
MQHIQGISRNQLQVSSLEDTISADNPSVLDLLAKLKTWNSPYKRKFLFGVKTTYLKLFLAQITFGTNQNRATFIVT